MIESISQKVNDYIKKHPRLSNEELYKMFPEVGKKVIKSYKAKFATSTKGKAKKKSSKTKPLSQMVFDYLKKDPEASNEVLYKAFPNHSKSSLRGYKATYMKKNPSLSPKKARKPGDQPAAKKAAKKTKVSKSTVKVTKAELEQRVVDLESRVEELNDLVDSSGKSPAKVSLSARAGSIEKRIRDLEDNLLKFIRDKRSKVSTELVQLEEMQNFVTTKISSFIDSIKNRKDS